MKKNKNFKGFTLIEVLVALAVLASLMLMLSVMYVAASKMTLMSSSMTKQTDLQASLAVNGGGITPTVYTGKVKFINYQTSTSEVPMAYNADFDYEVVEVNQTHNLKGADAPNIKYGQVKLP